jgi:hypothetical protein
MGATIRQIVDDTLALIGEVEGSGSQVYSEDQLALTAGRSFNLLIKKYAWEQYREWSTHTLDGVDGLVDADAFSTVRDFEDFLAVHRGGQAATVPVLPKTLNPNVLSGSSVLYWSSLPVTNANYATRRLQFWPMEATGTINVLTRVYPTTPFDWDTVLDLDRDMLVYGTSYMATIGDDLNPNAANTFRDLMEMRFTDIMAGISALPRHVASDMSVNTEWRER